MQIEFDFRWTNLCEKTTQWQQGFSSMRSSSVVCFIFANSFNSFSLKFRALTLNHFWGAVRTPITNLCVKQGLPTTEIDSKMIMSLKELSQVLVVARILISSSQEENILTVVKNLSTSPEFIKEPKSHELHSQDDLESSTDLR